MQDKVHVEVLAPRQDEADIDAGLNRFEAKYRAVLDAGFAVSLPDNPLGALHYQSTEVIQEMGLPVPPGQVLVHVNTFHPRQGLDEILNRAAELGVRHLLTVTGDGGERLSKLTPESLGLTCKSVTSVELLRYVAREHPGQFVCGVVFNPYEPQDHELEKLRRKLDAGAEFIITQPILARDERLDALRQFGKPVILGAWMSRKLHLLSECVGYAIPEDTPYDPLENLRALCRNYPDHGVYLAILGFKTQLPVVAEMLKEALN
jgi:methylenetetrahydrofolate reductase (NADPH)